MRHSLGQKNYVHSLLNAKKKAMWHCDNVQGGWVGEQKVKKVKMISRFSLFIYFTATTQAFWGLMCC